MAGGAGSRVKGKRGAQTAAAATVTVAAQAVQAVQEAVQVVITRLSGGVVAKDTPASDVQQAADQETIPHTPGTANAPPSELKTETEAAEAHTSTPPDPLQLQTSTGQSTWGGVWQHIRYSPWQAAFQSGIKVPSAVGLRLAFLVVLLLAIMANLNSRQALKVTQDMKSKLESGLSTISATTAAQLQQIMVDVDAHSSNATAALLHTVVANNDLMVQLQKRLQALESQPQTNTSRSNCSRDKPGLLDSTSSRGHPSFTNWQDVLLKRLEETGSLLSAQLVSHSRTALDVKPLRRLHRLLHTLLLRPGYPVLPSARQLLVGSPHWGSSTAHTFSTGTLSQAETGQSMQAVVSNHLGSPPREPSSLSSDPSLILPSAAAISDTKLDTKSDVKSDVESGARFTTNPAGVGFRLLNSLSCALPLLTLPDPSPPIINGSGSGSCATLVFDLPLESPPRHLTAISIIFGAGSSRNSSHSPARSLQHSLLGVSVHIKVAGGEAWALLHRPEASGPTHQLTWQPMQELGLLVHTQPFFPAAQVSQVKVTLHTRGDASASNVLCAPAVALHGAS